MPGSTCLLLMIFILKYVTCWPGKVLFAALEALRPPPDDPIWPAQGSWTPRHEAKTPWPAAVVGGLPCYSCYPHNIFKFIQLRRLKSGSLCQYLVHNINLYDFCSQSACHTFCHGLDWLDFSISAGDEVSSATPRSKASATRPPFGSNVMHPELDKMVNLSQRMNKPERKVL